MFITFISKSHLKGHLTRRIKRRKIGDHQSVHKQCFQLPSLDITNFYIKVNSTRIFFIRTIFGTPSQLLVSFSQGTMLLSWLLTFLTSDFIYSSQTNIRNIILSISISLGVFSILDSYSITPKLSFCNTLFFLF